MKCESCDGAISSAMRGSLKTNTCPWCGSSVMGDEKATQYFNLLEMLDQTTFTNRQDVDTQIKEKVASLMISNFIFMKLEQPEVSDDIIVVNETPVQQVVQRPVAQQAQTKKKKKAKKAKLQKESSSGKALNTVSEDQIDDSMASRVPTPRPKPKINANAPVTKTGLTLSDFQNAQEPGYTEAGSMMGGPGADSLNPDEIMKAFPGMTPEEAVQALQKEADMVQNSGPQKGLTGKGIRRLNG